MTPQDGWKQEADDLDAVLRLIGLDPQACRTEGGSLNIGRVRAAVEASARKLAAPERTDQAAPGFVMVPVEVVKFLTGEGPLDGLWFGEHPFGLGGGKYWWRNHLPAARPLTASPTDPSTEASEPVRSMPAEPVACIQWTLNGNKTCGYDNWVGETPFGRILITWKGWKEDPDACVDEFPGELPHFYGSPDEVKAGAEAEFIRRLRVASAPTPEPSDAKPSFREPTWKDEPPDWCSPKEEEIWQAGYDSAMASARSMNRSIQSGPVMHAPSGFTFDTVLAAANPEDLVSLTPPEPSDAERYQLVRRGQHWSVIDGIGNVLRGDDLDAAIDAIHATKGGKL